MLRNLQVLAESTQRLSELLKAVFPAVEWKKFAGFRNVLVHDYLGVDIERVWEIIVKDLPDLKSVIPQMLSSVPESSPDSTAGEVAGEDVS